MSENSEFMSRIRDLAEPVARREGCEIYDIEWVSGHHGKGRVLRVYIDKRGGVSLEDCANVSRGLNLILDVDDAIPGSGYSLEVSSPGLERNLRESRHFSAAIGSLIQVKLKEPKDNLRVFRGRLESLDDVNGSEVAEGMETTAGAFITVELDNKKQVKVRVEEIAKARTVFKEEKQPPRGGRKL